MAEPIPLRDVLRDIDSYSAKCWVYLSEVEAWRLDSPCLVLESEDVAPEEEDDLGAGVPEFARNLMMMQVLPISEVQDLVANAKMQKSDIDDKTIFDAFLYYYDNDAFLTLQ